MPSGFTGVDIFFVISGYLITKHIKKDLEAGQFRFLYFYQKRARRLLPVLFITTMTTAFFVYLFYMPVDAKNFGMSLASSGLLASNFYFFKQYGYFNTVLETSPLLHLWSLAVDEQFYLLFPALFLFLFKFKKVAIWLFVMALISLFASQIAVSENPSAAFYLPFFRFFQFIAGSLLVFMPTLQSHKIKEAISVAGGLLMVASVFCLSSTIPYPGVAALLPTIGAALFIHSANGSIVGRIASWALPRFIGRISYSVYLWHWPLIVFYKYLFSAHLSKPEVAGLFLASLVLGFLSYQFIEVPTIRYRIRAKSSFVSILAILCLMSFMITGMAFYLTNGMPWRLNESALKAAAVLDYKLEPQTGPCFIKTEDTGKKTLPQCGKVGQGNILLIGDSHAQHFHAALKSALPNSNVFLATETGCRPLLDGKGEKRCTNLMKGMFETYIPHHDIDVIIIAARWKTEDAALIHATINAMKKKNREIILFGPIIEYEAPLPRIMARSINVNNPSLPSSMEVNEVSITDKAIGDAANRAGARFVSLIDVMCPGSHCITLQHGKPIQFDYGHLTEEGADLLLKKMNLRDLIN